ncbi:MAG: glycosyltransferase family 4 protein [Candidatus Krumholzibacteriia bacterium]
MAPEPIRVAMIGQKGYPPVHGGIERHVAELARRLVPLGFAVDIYSRPHYSPLDGPADIPGVTVLRRPSLPTKHLDAITHTAIASVDVLRRPVDIVHYHALGPGLLAWAPRWLARKHTVITVHGLDWARDKWGPLARAVLRLGEAASARVPDRTIVVSRALREHYLREHRVATDYIPNGITPPCYRPASVLTEAGLPERFVLFAARLVPEKGCHLLLEAHAALPREARQAYPLLIAGDAGFTSGYASGLRERAHPEVRFLGFVHGELLEALFTHATLMVLPSTLEGLSITLLEGMGYGRPCLVSDIPPNLEAADGHAGVFRSGDARSLGEALRELLGDPGRRDRLGREGQLHAIEHYSWDRVAERTAALYREIVGGAKKITPGG